MTTREALTRKLAEAGLETPGLASDRNGRLLLLEQGARVLGLFPPGDDRNFLWVNPALLARGGPRKFFDRVGWPNPGGDRTWLAPEHALFFGEEEPSPKTYRIPPALDPGDFALRRINGTARFDGHAHLTVRGFGRHANVRLSKTIALAPNPLPPGAYPEAAYAGYTSNIRLAGRSPSPIALWQLLQLPHGGTMLVAVRGRPRARVLFGNIDRRDWRIADGLLRHRMDAAGNHKLGLFASSCTGRAGYLYPTSRKEWSLVIREWSVHPAEHYVDTPWRRRNGPGDCFQLCNIHSTIGRFSELEHHTPAGVREDCSTVWAFRGPKPTIEEIIRLLLVER